MIVWIVTWLCTWLVMALAVLSYGVYRMRATMNGIADKLTPFKFSISNENGTVKKIRRSDTVFYCCSNVALVSARSLLSSSHNGHEAMALANACSNNVYVVIDRKSPTVPLGFVMGEVSAACRKRGCKLFVVGQLGDDPRRRVCEEWKGDMDSMTFRGQEIDCSSAKSWTYMDLKSWVNFLKHFCRHVSVPDPSLVSPLWHFLTPSEMEGEDTK